MRGVKSVRRAETKLRRSSEKPEEGGKISKTQSGKNIDPNQKQPRRAGRGGFAGGLKNVRGRNISSKPHL